MAELLLEGLFEASPNPYLVLDRRLHIAGANRAYLASVKRELSDIVGRWAWDAFPADEETVRQAVASFERVIRTKQTDVMALLRFDVPRPEAEGGGVMERYWSITHSPVLGADGEVALVLQHPIDVTELQHLRAARDGTVPAPELDPAQSGIFDRARSAYESSIALKDQSDRLDAMFAHAPSFMALLRGRGHRFELANPSYMRLVGDRPLIGRTVAEVLPDAVAQGYLGLLDRVFDSGEPYTARGARYAIQTDPGGVTDERYVDFVYQPVKDAAGRVTGIFVEGSDVTDRLSGEAALRDLNATLEKRVIERTAELAAAQEALVQAQKMEAVGQLTGGLAHDFNNLLTGVTGSLELLQTRIAQGRIKDVDRYVNAAQGAARRAAALTHRLLAFSRRQTLDPKPTDVNRLVGGMEELIRRTVGPAITLEPAIGAAGLWSTLVDPGQLENALLNLCINARDAMPDGGKITIETANRCLDERMARDRELPPGHYVSLCVSDTGTGMPKEVITKAFDPFFTTKPIGQGTGLGLSMIYGFAKQSGGQVRIYSEVGQGTTVCLYLSRHLGDAETAEPAPEMANAPRAEDGQTVLIVDDEPTVRMLVTEVLEDLGYTAIEAADGVAGLKILQSDVRLDLLVTDVGLPHGLNGRQVADAARVARPELKVLFITGYAENAVLSHGHLGPGMHVLTKPFAMEALASRIKQLLSHEAGDRT